MSFLLPVVAAILALAVSSASAAGAVSWAIRGVPEPTRFSPNDAVRCKKESRDCDRYQLLPMNIGSAEASGAIVVKDKLPAGLVLAQEPESKKNAWTCAGNSGRTEVRCTYDYEEGGPIGEAQATQPITVYVTAPPSSSREGEMLKNEVSIEGGGATTVTSTSESTLISSQAPMFGSEFTFEVGDEEGTASTQAGGHPWQVTASLEVPTVELASPPIGAEDTLFGPVESWRSASVELPLGFLGDPQARAKCTESQLEGSGCPEASVVGAIEAGTEVTSDEFARSREGFTSPIYNMVPEGGYPAEFAVAVNTDSIYMYASVVHGAGGYRLRIAVPGLPGGNVGAFGTVLTFYGDPARVGGESSSGAFLTNPTHCSTEPDKARAEVESWGRQGQKVSSEATVYPQLKGCNLLQSQFDPTVSMGPSEAGAGPQQEGTSQADTPSAYSFDLTSPQKEGFEELATPELKNVTAALPEGVSVSPSAGYGLVGCDAEGANGINISGLDSEEVGPDGLERPAKGKCPEGSTLGTVDVFTPDLPTRCGGEGQAACNEPDEAAPLQGHVYLAQPECGGPGQPACSSAYAEGRGGLSGEGRLFGLYIEVEGSGVIVKLPGTVSANPVTGRLQATFKENPQFPFSELKLHLHGGPRAPLANPQTCGSVATESMLTSWAGQEVSLVAEPFSIDWDGHGGACPATMPFKPGFDAGTVTPIAGGYSPFVLQLSRQDGEQDLSGLEATLPEGLLAKLAGVPLCGEAQANAGTCSSESQIGTVTVTAGAGSEPLAETGRIYLTGPYNGGPYGDSVVVPAAAGPFNLDNVVVRGALHINPNTAQASIVSNPFPTIIDGVPLRVRTVDVEVNRPGFTFNPTDCNSQTVTATVTGAQGGSAAVSSPFAVNGCAGLPFKPSFKLSTQGKTSRVNGASLVVKIAQKPGEANIHKVHLAFPKSLPARLSSLRGACTEAQFAANPSGCPAGSVIGSGTAVTPVLSAPLSGPAYLVSHGNAAYPDVVFVLQGDGGVRIDLTGATDIKKGIAYSTFETVPDAPVSSFEAVLPEGPHAVFGANLPGKAKDSFCGRAPIVATTLEGQNAAVLVQKTRATVSNCPKKKPKHKTKKARRRRRSRGAG
ncbi:MAG: hypothetical protein ABSH36_00040 [Solirubrobacteraceae bacterium]